MVRAVVGTLVEVGRGKMTVDANRTLSQLSYRPIFVFQNENSVTLLERFVKDFSPGRPAGNGRVDLPFLKKRQILYSSLRF